MVEKKDKSVAPTSRSAGLQQPAGRAIDAFLSNARRLAPTATGQGGHLVFALDATMSRQPTWDMATGLQAQMFKTAADVGGLSVQLVYFRGLTECRASPWVAEADALTRLMTKIDCRGGHTQIGKVLSHVRREAAVRPVRVLVFVGDAMEENIDDLAVRAGELGLLGIKAFMFQEGRDPAAAAAFKEIARLTGGVYAAFDAGAPECLAGLLKAAAAYAGGGRAALEDLAKREAGEAKRLLTQMGPRS